MTITGAALCCSFVTFVVQCFGRFGKVIERQHRHAAAMELNRAILC
jgi:hypothetical protein